MKEELNRYIDILAGCEMFRGIDGERLAKLLNTMQARAVSFEKGETIYRYGDTVREAAIVLEGTVFVETGDAEGEKTNLNMLHRGDEFGAFLLVSGNTFSPMHIFAGTQCSICLFDLQLAQRSGDTEVRLRLMNNLIRSFASKCVELYTKVQIYGKKRIRSRIRMYLMSLKQRDGEVLLPMNRTALASYLGVDRTALAREMGRMQEEGIIAVNKRRVKLLDRDFFLPGAPDGLSAYREDRRDPAGQPRDDG